MNRASNNDIKLLRKLNRKKYREKEQAFIVEGERAVSQVLENNMLDVQAVFVKEGVSFEALKIPVKIIDAGIFDDLADTEHTQGILALCAMPPTPALQEIYSRSGIILATDALQDPGNMGTIIRTASWFGVQALLAGKGSVDVYHPKVVRSTAGATGSIPIIGGDLHTMLSTLEDQGWTVHLLDGGPGSRSLKKVSRTGKDILVIGNEGNGIDENMFTEGRNRISIEAAALNKQVESLNAGVAASIALFSFTE